MMINIPNFSQTLSLVRMERLHILSSKQEYISHIYSEILNRLPEQDPSEYTIELPVGDVGARLDYLNTVLFSDESAIQRRGSYDGYLEAFLAALGYTSARIYLSELLKNLYPTLEYFKTMFPDIILVVKKNTEVALLRLAADENFIEWNSAVNLSIIADRLVTFEESTRKLQESLDHVAWLIRDMKSNGAEHGHSSTKTDLNTDLLLAIMAKLDIIARK